MVTNTSSDLTKYRFTESKLSLPLSEFLLSVTRHFIKASTSSCLLPSEQVALHHMYVLQTNLASVGFPPVLLVDGTWYFPYSTSVIGASSRPSMNRFRAQADFKGTDGLLVPLSPLGIEPRPSVTKYGAVVTGRHIGNCSLGRVA